MENSGTRKETYSVRGCSGQCQVLAELLRIFQQIESTRNLKLSPFALPLPIWNQFATSKFEISASSHHSSAFCHNFKNTNDMAPSSNGKQIYIILLLWDVCHDLCICNKQHFVSYKERCLPCCWIWVSENLGERKSGWVKIKWVCFSCSFHFLQLKGWMTLFRK